MGYLSCNAESAIATCDSSNWPHFTQRRHKNPRAKPFKVLQFSFSDLHSATNGFSETNFLGKGSHGSVYKAHLHRHNLTAAVKRTTSNDTATTPADNEIEILSYIRSPRLVNLLGFCADSSNRKFIVVEFMPNGSLYDLLHTSPKPPGWVRRLRFVLQVAKAVQHLHSSNPPVIHRDIKSSNVLIDGSWSARLGDFGLALRGHVEDVKVRCTPPAGTLGYLDPGYLAPADLSTKSDVFSFGILMLEVISGRNAIDMNFSPASVVDWATPMIRSGEYAGICDPRIGPPEDATAVRQLAVLAAKCVRATAEKRPAMADVVECLVVVRRRVESPIWNNIGRRVGRVRRSAPLNKYEPLDDGASEMVKTSRAGSRRNRKVSSVPVVEMGAERVGDRVARSRSIGSVSEMRSGPLDLNLPRRRGPGLAVKMPSVRLSKSRSTGVLEGPRLVDNNAGVMQVVRNPNGKEFEESKLLINLEKEAHKGD
ncbi:hypothetical protein RJ639_023895 [Escallonia herrerae]|uniref:Protein kinase domain-containing protein n=1 Tax=Escallonia herrerae TaxID=1293975 RepID=A0AA88UYJ2_9ASTE|nr:hypothetical protein RJ639_023895 [Escallonia herrerae]